ncbi:Candida_ALS_N domain-containing protein [Candida albicans]
MKTVILLHLFFYCTIAMAKTISGVFTSFNSLTYTNTGNYPYGGPGYPTWTAVLGWSLDGTLASPGDTFTLVMPCVFKFITTQTSVDLTANGVKYATCTFHAGEDFTTFSSMSCVVNNGLSSNIRAFGTVRLPISFNVGGTGSSVNIQDSKCFTAGTNTVTFTDGDHKISTTVNFPKTPQSSSSLVYFARVIPSLDKLSSLVVASQCTAGYASGVLGFSATKDDVTIDCSTIHVGITNGLNSWNMPVSSESFSYTKTCTPNSFIITYENVPAGYRPFIDSYVKKSATATNGFNLNYTNIYNCMDGKKGNDPLIYFWTSYTNSDAGSNGAAVVVTTRTVTDSTTAITTLPFDPTVDKTKTIEVIEPIPTTTITTSYVGISTSLSTKTATIGGTATVVVDVPYHTTTTITSIWTGSATTSSTYTNPTDSIDTVVVQVPSPNPTVTTTQFWSGSVPTTETVTTGPQGTDSVIIKEPHNPTVTTTEFWSESFATTETVTNGPEGTDSVIVREPHNPTVTTTEFWSESFATTETVTNGPEGTDSVIVREPHNPTVTTTEFWSESFATTETITTGPLGTDSIVIHDPLEESSSSTAIESSDSNISSSAQESSSSVEQSLTSADETSSIVELSSSSDIPSSSIGLTSSESSTVSSYDSYSSSTSESSIASSYDSYWSSSIESSTLSSSDRYSSSISDTTSFWDSSSSDLESTSITWSSSIDAQSSHLVQSVSNSISTSQEISSSSSEESSTSATDALVSSDASSILSSDTSSYYPSSTISPSDDFPHTIAGESDSQSISFITSTVEISSDSVSLTSDPASSFDSSSSLNSDSSSSPSSDQSDILTSSSFSTLVVPSFSLSSSSSLSLTYPHYVNSTTYHASESESSSVASPSMASESANDDTHTLSESTDTTSSIGTDSSTVTFCRRDNGDGCIVTGMPSSSIDSEQTSDVTTTSSFVASSTPTSAEQSITDNPNIDSSQTSASSSTKLSVFVSDTVVNSISLSETSTLSSDDSTSSDTSISSTTNSDTGNINAGSSHTSTASIKESSIQKTGVMLSSSYLSTKLSSTSDITTELITTELTTTELTTIEDNEPNTFTSTPSSHSEIFSSDNSVLSKQVDGESTVEIPPVTDTTTVSSVSVHSIEASTATLGENSFSKVASAPVNTETSLRSTSSSSNHATESSGTVKSEASAEAIPSPPTSTDNRLSYSTEEAKGSTYANSGSTNNLMTESQVAAPTDSTSVLTANPVVTSTFDDKSSAAVNQPSKTKSIEESIGSLDSVNETNNGFIATLSQSEAPNSLIHSESISTTMAKTTDASINGDSAASNSQPTTLIQQVATSSYNQPLITTYAGSSSATKHPSWLLKFISVALFFFL